MKVIVAGSRNVTNYTPVFEAIDQSGFCNQISEIVSGTARGVDTLGEYWAKEFNIPVKQFPADWEGLGKRAGFVRNTEMAEYADALIAVWDGESKGTAHMINIMEKMRKPVYIHLVPK